MSAGAVIKVLELVGLYAFATSGALMAIQKSFDVVGILVLAMLTALGGGILRDLVIGDTPPAAFTELSYLVVPLVATAVTFFAHPVLRRLTRTVLVFDAAGLALFCVTGTLKALDFGLGSLQAVLLGITTAVGGGVLRDITAREAPALLRADTELYAIPAAVGAVIVAGAHHTGLPMPVVATGAAVLVFGFRIAAMLRHWTAPHARVPRRQRVGPAGSED
ncbi:trimeric intracellular cation channel family protein [Jidongwangia harbinensis]|uniref:trimeric intracellular cation channel family protein n=1 Tax=Jidongwangia harbinensis TaxID=2878561 RepID=UPI001CDA000C|nr:trimeric intracellular cation channel family protein [Jidongwangia harbinensis]MCA2211766.1 trimeric intracellular cation channel family protein [Jidongwangia harbinensis]